MKTIGLLGGMSWQSTASYYKIINELVKQKLGGLHSAKIILCSLDFQEIAELQKLGDWQILTEKLIHYAKIIEKSGADILLICTNTMHKLASKIEKTISIPLLHIAESLAQQLLADGIKKVGLLGTKFTMSQDFYKQKLENQFGIQVITPDLQNQEIIHKVIFDELCLGKINEYSRQQYRSIIGCLEEKKVQAIVLGCTEINLLLQQKHSSLPLYDTTTLHSRNAVDWALSAK